MDYYSRKIATVTNLFVLGSIGFIIASFLRSSIITIKDIKSTSILFIVGGILIIISGFIEFNRKYEEKTPNHPTENKFLLTGMVVYIMGVVFLLLSILG